MAIAEQDWDHLIDQVDAKCPGSSRGSIRNDVYDTIHEFLDDSSAWTENLSVIVTPASQTYDVVVTEGQIVRLAGVVDVNNYPIAAIMPTVGTLDFKYPVNTTQTFTATMVKTVSLPTSKKGIPVGPDWVLPLFGVGILDGALGRMMTQIGKPYSNPTQGAYHLQRYRKAIGKARTAALRRNTIGTQAWVFPQNYSTRNQRSGVSIGNTSQFF